MTNKLILGTVQLGLEYGINNKEGKPSLEQSFDILHTSFDNDLKILDTAEAYGNSQEVIGEFHKRNPKKKFKIITKLSANHNLNNSIFIDNIKNDCSILDVDQLYGYMFHNYHSFKENVSFYNEILKAKKLGIIKYAGISLYDNFEIEDIIQNYSEFDFIQIPFNLFDNELKRKEVIDKATEKGISTHIRSVFLQGLFFRDPSSLSGNLIKLAPYLKRLNEIKEKNKLTTETLALHYVLQKKYISNVLIGVENTTQLLNNIKSSKNKKDIPHDLLDKVNILEEELLNPSNWN